MVNVAGFQTSWYMYSASRYGSFPFPRSGPWCGECFTTTTTAFCYQLTALGGDHDNVASHETGWPWRFEQPGRLSTELPREEAFTGFGGLEALVGDLDLGTGIDDMRDGCQKASREIRNACHSQVSIDPAPGAEVVVISETGASLTGIPPEAVSITNTGDQGSRGSSSIRWSERKHKDLAHHLTGTTLSRGSQPLGCCYGGHQFGHWVGQLGDGRVATLGEIRAVCNRDNVKGVASAWCGNLIEVQLKGIGKTPFSRGGDGKAVLNSCLSEYLFSQAFVGLGLGTAVTVSVCSTGETTVTRDSKGTLKRVSGAVLCRTAPSFLRFGSFELPARRNELNVVRTLADFCLRHLGPHLKRGECPPGSFPYHTEDLSPMPREDEVNMKGPFCSFSAGQEGERSLQPYLPKSNTGRAEESPGSHVGEVWTRNAYLELLVDVIQATARMVASWQAFGFCHGVLNTDNFSLLGIAIDFGSCGFMEQYDPAWCPNKSDSGLRYTFQKQPDVAAWNCERLADAFSSLIGVSGVAEAKKAFSPTFDAAYTEHLQRKLGLANMKLVGGRGWVDILKNQTKEDRGDETVGNVSSDTRFVLELLRLMACTGTDFTKTWQSLINVPSLSEARGDRAECYEGDEEVLRPITGVLRDSRVPREHRHEWACWIRKYMARIDSQGIGRSDHRGPQYGRRKRFDTMKKRNPVFVLRGSDLKQALSAVDAEDMTLVRQLDTKLSRPYASESSEEIPPSRASH